MIKIQCYLSSRITLTIRYNGPSLLLNISGKIHLLKNIVDANMSLVYMELDNLPQTKSIMVKVDSDFYLKFQHHLQLTQDISDKLISIFLKIEAISTIGNEISNTAKFAK